MAPTTAVVSVPNGATPGRPRIRTQKRTHKRDRLYRALDQERHEFRLLTIFPRTTQAPKLNARRKTLTASIATESLDSPSEYIALSYVWSPDCSYSFVVDGIRLAISGNLWSAIEQIRHDTEPIRIWVDAICINQVDLDEKAWQIGLMSRIYQQACRTVIWLGDGLPALHQAMEFLCTLTPNKFFHEMKILEQSSQKQDLEAGNHPSGLIGDFNIWSSRSPRSPLAKWENLRSILGLRWWGRRWVIQEAFLSKSPRVVLGHVSVAMDKFAELATWHARYLSTTRNAHILAKVLFRECPFYYLLRQWKIYRRDIFVHRAPLPVWLTLTRDFDQSIPRDLIFGLLSLASARDQLNIQPDYWGSDHMVFTRLFIHLIEIYGFRTFRFVLPSCESFGGLNLPSWCSGDKYGGFQDAVSPSKLVSNRNELWNACGSTEQSIRFVYEFSGLELAFTRPGSPKSTLSRDISMVAKGFQLDEVAIVLPTGLSSNGADDIPFNSLEEQLQAVAKSWRRRLMGIQMDPYRDTCGRSEAMCMTLLGGRCSNLTKEDWRRQFLEWIQPEDSFSIHAGKKSHSVAAEPNRGLFYVSIRPRCFNRSLFITTKGYVGLGPLDTEEGDVISIFHGVAVPLVLRKQDKARYHSFLGETYVHGIMHGEAVDEDNRRNETDFTLV